MTMLRMPPLADIQAFALVGELGSLTKAAALLNVTQPAISKRIRSLERWLGVALVNRQANRLRLTAEGTSYAAASTHALAAIQAATEALRNPPAGPVCVRAYTTWAMRWLIPRLTEFYAGHPLVDIVVTTSNLPVDFREQPVDVAIRMAGAIPPAAGAARLQLFSLAPFAAPTVQALDATTRLVSQARPRDWTTWAAAAGVVLADRTMQFESTNFAIEAAVKGLGAVITTPLLVDRELREGTLRQLHPMMASTNEYYWLLLPPTPRAEAIAFRDWLVHLAGRPDLRV